MSNDWDRTVHGATAEGDEIVRYDRAGKWYVEPTEGKRRAVTLTEAARLAIEGTMYDRRPGGMAFRAEVRKVRKARPPRQGAQMSRIVPNAYGVPVVSVEKTYELDRHGFLKFRVSWGGERPGNALTRGMSASKSARTLVPGQVVSVIRDGNGVIIGIVDENGDPIGTEHGE